MKKLLILVAVLLMVSPVFAQSGGRLFVQPNATFATGSPATTSNNDSCDIGTAPAATLLLPWFEVDYTHDSTQAVNTIFTVTNTSAVPEIAHVVVWTDWSYPVLDFNIWLTGYDVQGISLYDILANGQIPVTGAADNTNSPDGGYSTPTNGEHSWTAGVSGDCSHLPGPIPTNLLAAVQAALTTGDGSFYGAGTIGSSHASGNAVGYVTVDTVAVCTTNTPLTGIDYFSTDILWDNALIGDYQRINPSADTGNYAGGNPMVSIRAIPGGGTAPGTGDSQTTAPFTSYYTNLPFTFYDRYLGAGADGNSGYDRRQPLPGVFAARFIEGGSQSFNTNLAIWREGFNNGSTPEDNGAIPFAEMVRFDEHENPNNIETTYCQISPCPGPGPSTTFPETSNYDVDSGQFPAAPSGTADLGGWIYMNMNAGLPGTTYASTGATRPVRVASQNWVIVQMTAEGRYGVDFDAAWLGNGCSGDPGPQAAGGVCGDQGATTDCGIGPLPSDGPIF